MTAHLTRPDATQVLVIVPTYNELDSVGQLVNRLFAACGDSVDLLVVDDASPDGTAELVKELAAGPHEIHLIQRPSKQGLGTAYLAGFKWALEREYSGVVEMDADLSHDPKDVPRLLDALEDADLVIGSRYVNDGSVRNWSLLRRLLSRVGNFYARMWLRFPVRDATSGFRAFRTETLENLDLESIRAEGYAFQIETTWRVHRTGGTIVEIPIEFVERTAGRSKMNRTVVVEALGRVTRWGLRDLFRRS